VSAEHTWLDLVPPRGAAPDEAQLAAEPGRSITVTADEFRQLNTITNMASHYPDRDDDVRQVICRVLGPQRVAAILQNSERGLGTPVVVEP
jgi:hypothetical protein